MSKRSPEVGFGAHRKSIFELDVSRQNDYGDGSDEGDFCAEKLVLTFR